MFSNRHKEILFLRLFALSVFAATLILNLWEWFAWHLKLSQKQRVVPRDIRGTWKGRLTSYWEDPETGQRPAPKTVYLTVRQTATTVTLVFFTDEAKSYSTLCRVRTNIAIPAVEYLYEGRPDSRVEDRSRAHLGAAVLDIVGRPASKLQGHYWTDRNSRGELLFDSRNKNIADDYDGAAAFFQ